MEFATLGTPRVQLRVASDRPLGMLAIRLNDVWPDGASARVSYGLLNLAHRDGDDRPAPLEPGKYYDVTVRLNDIGHVFRPGNRIRLAISTIYWPTIWPSPAPVTITISTDELKLVLPERPARTEDAGIAFALAVNSPPQPMERLRTGGDMLRVEHDLATDEWRKIRHRVSSSRILDIGTTETIESGEIMSIRRGDPLSARHEIKWSIGLARGEWQPRVELTVTMTSTSNRFLIDSSLSAFEARERIFNRAWSQSFDRDHL
jgi:hypothetical protein